MNAFCSSVDLRLVVISLLPNGRYPSRLMYFNSYFDCRQSFLVHFTRVLWKRNEWTDWNRLASVMSFSVEDDEYRIAIYLLPKRFPIKCEFSVVGGMVKMRISIFLPVARKNRAILWKIVRFSHPQESSIFLFLTQDKRFSFILHLQ